MSMLEPSLNQFPGKDKPLDNASQVKTAAL
jgi:hypothetical protein